MAAVSMSDPITIYLDPRHGPRSVTVALRDHDSGSDNDSYSDNDNYSDNDSDTNDDRVPATPFGTYSELMPLAVPEPMIPLAPPGHVSIAPSAHTETRRTLEPVQLRVVLNDLRKKYIPSGKDLKKKNEKKNPSLTYGELNYWATSEMGKYAKIDKNTNVLDFGSGIGNVVIQLALEFGCTATGVEMRQSLHDIGLNMVAALEAEGYLQPGQVTLIHGNGLELVDIGGFQVVYVNNERFEEVLELALLEKIKNEANAGTRFFFVRNVCPRYRRNPLKAHICDMFSSISNLSTDGGEPYSWKHPVFGPYLHVYVMGPRSISSVHTHAHGSSRHLMECSSSGRGGSDALGVHFYH